MGRLRLKRDHETLQLRIDEQSVQFPIGLRPHAN